MDTREQSDVCYRETAGRYFRRRFYAQFQSVRPVGKANETIPHNRISPYQGLHMNESHTVHAVGRLPSNYAAGKGNFGCNRREYFSELCSAEYAEIFCP